ncbi:MAG: adventurous gliding motility protein CglE [Pseudomonadota bacterium]
MHKVSRLLALAVIASNLLAPLSASADEYDDLDDLGRAKAKEKKHGKSYDFEGMQVKEITRGFYAKTNIGGWLYLLDFRGYVRPGTSMALALGQDFVDNERNSMAWEVSFFQGIHNGTHYEIQADDPAAPHVQGDLRTYSGIASIEWSGYPARRLGIGARLGGGVLFSPLLISEQAWQEVVLTLPGYNTAPEYHHGPKPLVMVGPTFEYYTKMSHFSIGADVDAIYAIGFDLGVSISGAIKYTF